MATMTATDTSTRSTGRLTRADLDAMPDDRRRYELLDGAIIVSPSPGSAHQAMVTGLWQRLQAVAPAGLRVFVAPLDVVLPTGDVLEPDVVVARREIVTETDIAGVPELVVEVLSPSSRRRDVGDKLRSYEAAGVPAYWVVDPIEPRLRVWDLVDGAYVETAAVAATQTWTATSPYAVTLRPGDLLG